MLLSQKTCMKIFSSLVLPLICMGNMNAAIQDLLHKTLAKQDFLLSQITHIVTESEDVRVCGVQIPVAPEQKFLDT
jgi:hypothetical protein